MSGPAPQRPLINKNQECGGEIFKTIHENEPGIAIAPAKIVSSCTSSPRSDRDLDATPSPQGTSNTSVETETRDFGAVEQENSGVDFCLTTYAPDDVEKIRQAAERNDEKSKSILDKNNQEHAQQSSLQTPCRSRRSTSKPADLFTQAEVDEKIEAAIEENSLYWNGVSQREKENAPLSYSQQQVEEMVAMAVDKRNAHWEFVLDSKRKEYAGRVQRLQAENLEQRETQTAKSKHEAASQNARHAHELKAKDALIIGVGEIWQARFDQRAKDLSDANDRLEILERLVGDSRIDLAEETMETAKYENFLNFACDTANQTFLEWSTRFTQLEGENALLFEEHNKVAVQLSDLADKHLELTERHTKLAAEYNAENAQRQQFLIEIEELKNELDHARRLVQQPKPRRTNGSKPLGRMPTSSSMQQPAIHQEQPISFVHPESSGIWNTSGNEQTPFGHQDNAAFAPQRSPSHGFSDGRAPAFATHPSFLQDPDHSFDQSGKRSFNTSPQNSDSRIGIFDTHSQPTEQQPTLATESSTSPQTRSQDFSAVAPPASPHPFSSQKSSSGSGAGSFANTDNKTARVPAEAAHRTPTRPKFPSTARRDPKSKPEPGKRKSRFTSLFNEQENMGSMFGGDEIR